MFVKEGREAEGPTRLVYAVYGVAAAARAFPAGHGACDRNTDRRFVVEDISDEMLLKQVAEGDKAAMHIVFARHRTKVSRFIQRMVHNPTIAEHLVSQVFLDLWRSTNRLEDSARISTWLLFIARFKAVGEQTCVEQQRALEAVGALPEAKCNSNETSGFPRTCIDKLSPAHREVIELSYCDMKSVAEISKVVGTPQATVNSRLFYARKQLAKILVRVGLDAEAPKMGWRREDVALNAGMVDHHNTEIPATTIGRCSSFPSVEIVQMPRPPSDSGPSGNSTNAAGPTF